MVKRCKIGAEEIVPCAIEAVMVHLKNKTKTNIKFWSVPFHMISTPTICTYLTLVLYIRIKPVFKSFTWVIDFWWHSAIERIVGQIVAVQFSGEVGVVDVIDLRVPRQIIIPLHGGPIFRGVILRRGCGVPNRQVDPTRVWNAFLLHRKLLIFVFSANFL